MKIVIDIDEIAYKGCLLLVKHGEGSASDIAIANGTPLPKGHGRLIDADKYKDRYENVLECEIDHPLFEETIEELIDQMPTVIEADKDGGKNEVSN